MKKMLMTTLVVAVAGLICSADARTGSLLPDGSAGRKELRKERRAERRWEWEHSADALTQAAFYIDFPEAGQVDWRKGVFNEAHFAEDGIWMTAYYDDDHELVGTTKAVDASALPARALATIEKKYPGYQLLHALFFEDNEASDMDMNLYAGTFEDADNFFAELSNGTKTVILQVSPSGTVSFFTEMN